MPILAIDGAVRHSSRSSRRSASLRRLSAGSRARRDSTGRRRHALLRLRSESRRFHRSARIRNACRSSIGKRENNSSNFISYTAIVSKKVTFEYEETIDPNKEVLEIEAYFSPLDVKTMKKAEDGVFFSSDVRQIKPRKSRKKTMLLPSPFPAPLRWRRAKIWPDCICGKSRMCEFAPTMRPIFKRFFPIAALALAKSTSSCLSRPCSIVNWAASSISRPIRRDAKCFCTCSWRSFTSVLSSICVFRLRAQLASFEQKMTITSISFFG